MQVSVQEAKTNLSKLLEKVPRGERVIITRRGVTTSELIPAHPTKVSLGGLKDVVAPPHDDFLAPMDENALQIWEGNDCLPSGLKRFCRSAN